MKIPNYYSRQIHENEGDLDMRDKETLHRKVQELIDCFATTDPLKEMSELGRDSDRDEAALKWLALAALHGINMNAKKISLQKKDDGRVTVTAEYRKAELPPPGASIGEKIIEDLRAITHIEGKKAKTTLASGIRDGSIDLGVKVKKDEKGEKLTLSFPE
jgi:hypothetical protein